MCSSGTKVKSYSKQNGHWMDPASEEDLASIIIPTYNRSELLEETLASAAAQTYRPLEIVVVDDGSTDDTPDVVDRWQWKLGRDPVADIRYIRQKNSGVGAARNRGLIESRGEFIQFLDSDDILNRWKLSLQIDCLRQFPESGLAFSDMANLDDPDKWKGMISVDHADQTDSSEYFCNSRILTMVGVYRRRTCYLAGPWSEDISLGEDEEYGLRALLATPKLVYLPGNLCAFRDHPGPRLTDPQKDDRGLICAMLAYGRMVETARSGGRLGDPRLVASLARKLNEVLLPALRTGRHALAEEAIQTSRDLPISPARRFRLAIYGIFNRLPGGVFSVLWPLWANFRHAVFELPYREFRLIRARIIAGRSGQPSVQTARGNRPGGG